MKETSSSREEPVVEPRLLQRGVHGGIEEPITVKIPPTMAQMDEKATKVSRLPRLDLDRRKLVKNENARHTARSSNRHGAKVVVTENWFVLSFFLLL